MHSTIVIQHGRPDDYHDPIKCFFFGTYIHFGKNADLFKIWSIKMSFENHDFHVLVVTLDLDYSRLHCFELYRHRHLKNSQTPRFRRRSYYCQTSNQDAHAPESGKYVKDPLSWPELGSMEWSSRRDVYAKWTISSSPRDTNDFVSTAITASSLNNILDHDRLFPAPGRMHNWRALVLPSVASASARKAMEEYRGLQITCEYLGALDTSSCQDAHAPESGKYVKDPLSWPELGSMEWSSRRDVYAKWTISSSSRDTHDFVSTAITSSSVNNILDLDRPFPAPAKMHNCRALLLPSVASASARKAMEEYKGLQITCEYLGALDTSSCQDAHAPVPGKHVKDPLSWPELGSMERSSRRDVYAKWTISSSSKDTKDFVSTAITSSSLNNILDHDRLFPAPAEMHNLRALVLPSVASASARKAMEEYEGFQITCEYLGALDTSSCQDAHAPESGKHVKDPLSWPELGSMERSSRREKSASMVPWFSR
jgi:hypothetical protein